MDTLLLMLNGLNWFNNFQFLIQKYNNTSALLVIKTHTIAHVNHLHEYNQYFIGLRIGC